MPHASTLLSPVQRQRMQHWIDTLRSGKYQQDRLKLKTNHGFCCLGVACDISGIGSWNKDNQYVINTELSYEEADVKWPMAVVHHFGFQSTFEILIETMDKTLQYDTLVTINDGGTSFDHIADILQAWLNGWNLSIVRQEEYTV